MRHKKRKHAVCAGLLGLFCCCLSGCSFSFCGFPVGGREELVFTCEKSMISTVDAEEADMEKQVSVVEDKVNLNTAGKEELMTLNGIGETRAEAIIAYREQNGPFQRTEDIMQIPGIKEGIFSKIKEQITVQ